MTATNPAPIAVLVDRRDSFLSNHILSALRCQMPQGSYKVVDSLEETYNGRTLQFLDPAYATAAVDWNRVRSTGGLVSMYQECDALTLKHRLDWTVRAWVSKHPHSILKTNMPISATLDIDYADFLDEALDREEAGDLRARLLANEGKVTNLRDWWILKPSFADNRTGIGMFASRDDLAAIFRKWERDEDEAEDDVTSVTASALRYFVAQSYVHPPFISGGKKIGIRTHVVAAGDLRVFVARNMRVRCAAKPYVSPSEQNPPDLDAHLAGTEDTRRLFWEIDDSQINSIQKDRIFDEICALVREVFLSASNQGPAFFPTSPCAFEVFGVDFLLDANLKAWLLEVNPGPELSRVSHQLEWTVQKLYSDIIDVIVKPYFGVLAGGVGGTESFVEVLRQDGFLSRQTSIFQQRVNW